MTLDVRTGNLSKKHRLGDVRLGNMLTRTAGTIFSRLQKNVLDSQRWSTRARLHLAIVAWIEKIYHRKRRQRDLGRLTPVEFETIKSGLKAA